jgi:N-acyl-D-aspartate/D-glutamate deacylase
LFANLKLVDRGRLKPGFWADLAILDHAKISDDATFAKLQ